MKDRITFRNSKGEALVVENSEQYQPCMECNEEHCRKCMIAEIVDRIAEYEDMLPDMYEALEKALLFIESRNVFSETRQAIGHALAKARGESHA